MRFTRKIQESPVVYGVWLLIVIFFIVFIIYPLVSVLVTPSFLTWKLVFSSPSWLEAIKNTLLLTFCSTVLSVFTGYVVAYTVVRGPFFGKKLFSFMPLLHLVTPPFVSGLAFILLFGKQGIITKDLLHLDISLYGFPGLLLAQTLCFFPVAYVILKQNLENIPSSLEQAARAMGASSWNVFRRITFPLSVPGLISSALFIAISVLSDFGNPMLIGGRFRVLSVEIYTQISGWTNSETSAALGVLLLIPSWILFIVQRKYSWSHQEQLAIIGSRSGILPIKKNNRLVHFCLWLFCIIITCLTFAHFFVIIQGSLSKIWGVNFTFTLEHIASIVRYKREIKNSLVFALCAALIASIIASFISFLIQRTKVPGKKLFDSLTMIPAAIPGSLVGLSYVLAFSKPYFKLTGTVFIMVIAMVISYLPVGYRIQSSIMSQIRKTLDNSAQSLGASTVQVYKSIILPLSFKGFLSSFIYIFVQASSTLSTVIFLISFKTPVTSVAILNLAEQGDWGMAAALALGVTALTFLIIGCVVFLLWCLKRGKHGTYL